MAWPDWVWMIALPLVTSPLVYLLGRLFDRLGASSSTRRPAALGASPMAARLPVHGAAGRPRANPVRWVSLAILAGACVSLVLAWRDYAAGVPMGLRAGGIVLRFDGLSLLLCSAVLGLGTVVSLFSGPYIRDEHGQEKYHALLNAMIGAMLGLACAGDLFNLWVWFETTAVASYMLVACHAERPASLEAGVKYLVQNSVGSMLVLIGIGLVFSQTGTLDLAECRAAIAGGAGGRPLFLAAGALFCIGFGVKIAMVPMHTWLPDAHSQAPSGISAMLSGVVIEAGLVALLRALSVVAGASGAWGALLLAFGCVNMLAGNLLALRQTQVKRLLAFSSIAHVGYMLLGLGFAIGFGQADGAQGAMFHVLTHASMKGLAFLAAGCLLFALRLSKSDPSPLEVPDLAGAARRYPLVSLCLSVGLLGLGGLPPLGGFMSKWQIFVAGAAAGGPVATSLVVFGVLNSLLSLAYYAPLVGALYRTAPSALVAGGGRVPPAMAVPLVILALAVCVFGVWPSLADCLTAPAARTVIGLFAAGGGM